MTYTPTNWVDGSTPLNRANMMRIENELALLDGAGGWAAATPVQTTLPGSPVDGQEVILTDSLTAPSYHWRMRYLAASTFAEKWFFIGGQPMIGWYAAGDAMPGAWAAYNPTLTTPFTGVYTFAAQAVYNPTAANGLISISGWHDGTFDNEWQQLLQTGAAGYYSWNTIGQGKLLTAGNTLQLAGNTNIACNISSRMISMLPIRVR